MSKDLLNLSDEELMNLDPSALEGFTFGDESDSDYGDDSSVDDGAESTEGNTDDGAADSQASNTQTSDNEETDDGEAIEGSGSDEIGRGQEAGQEGLLNDGEEGADDAASSPDAADTPEKKEGQEDKAAAGAASIDYKSEYERLMAPFKANGRDIQVKSVEDAVSLMQMGANYNKKMAALKPNLKLLKMLENSGLLSEEKLSYLIDLDKKNPAAISKLVKDSGLDPLDIDTEKAGGYKPNTYTVDDRELALDSVLEEILDTPSYNRTLDVVTNKWDAPSKRVVAENPQLLKVINSHIDMGIYDLISKEVESERLFGRLSGISDLEAYRQVGDAIQARGGFAHLGRQEQKTPNAPVVVAPKPKKAEDPKVREQRRAASTTKPAAPAVTPAEFNPLSMSDEEFSKATTPKFN